MGRLFLSLSFFYLFIVIIFIGFSQITATAIVYADYVPTPTFSQTTPQEIKQLFFSVVQDGENDVQPATNSNVVFHGPRNRKEIALTFDADMTPWMRDQLLSGAVKSYYNSQLIAYLDKTHTKATLFLTGMWIELYQKDAQKLAADPLFELGSHSYSHPSFAGYCYGLEQITQAQKQPEITKTQALLFHLTHTRNTLFRFPGGCYDQDTITLMKKNGLEPIQWDVVADDGFNDNTQGIIDTVLQHVQNGSIVVMHMNGYPNDPKTMDALPEIITTLKQRGYAFVTISELLQKKTVAMKPNVLQNLRNYLLSDKQVPKNGV